MDLQALFDGMSARNQKVRAEIQMTLGKLIDFLKEQPEEKPVTGLGSLDSYRGYYADLAFDPDPTTKQAGKLLDECSRAMGEVYEGYKGGDYQMGRNTPLWVARYGCCGTRLMGLEDQNGTLVPITADEPE